MSASMNARQLVSMLSKNMRNCANEYFPSKLYKRNLKPLCTNELSSFHGQKDTACDACCRVRRPKGRSAFGIQTLKESQSAISSTYATLGKSIYCKTWHQTRTRLQSRHFALLEDSKLQKTLRWHQYQRQNNIRLPGVQKSRGHFPSGVSTLKCYTHLSTRLVFTRNGNM